MSQLDEEQVHGYIADLKSVENHTLNAVKKQKEAKGAKSDEEAYALLQHIEKALSMQVEKLDKAASRFGSSTTSNVKNTLTGITGTIAGMIDQARKDPVSKLMRDNYTAIAMITSGHTMLKTVALIIEDEDLQHLAGNSLKELAQITTEISRYLPLAVARELVDNDKEANRIGHTAMEKTQKAWNSENVKKGKDIV
jgi:hypothetical protein